ncbi:hypothetical protein CO614_09870 [Lysobacteraceae bacterium NML120232]|nr:hypothetical protein CO614_09870 [Xanthomonadaceae bacterium NML120232]
MSSIAKQPFSKALAEAIERCYQAFGDYPVPSELDVCTQCCMAPEMEAQMRKLPLRDIPAEYFHVYNSSAKADVQRADEVGYFLPRMLELIAQGEELHYSTEMYLVRLERCPKGGFTPLQWQAVQAAAEAVFAEALSRYPWQPYIHEPLFVLFDVLLMWHKGGLDIQPMLDFWQRSDTPSATLQYADSAWFGYWVKGGIDEPFAEDQPQYISLMEAWLKDENHQSTFLARLLALDVQAVPGVEDWWCGGDFIPELLDAMRQGMS